MPSKKWGVDHASRLVQDGRVRTRIAVGACFLVLGACGRQNYDPREGSMLDAWRDPELDAGASDDAATDAGLDAYGADAACATGDVRLSDGSCAPPLTLGVEAHVGARSTYLDVAINGPATLHTALTIPGIGGDPTEDAVLAMPAASPDVLAGIGITRIQVRHAEETSIDFHVVAHRQLADGSRESLVWTESSSAEPLLTIRTITFGPNPLETAVFVPDVYRADPTTPRPTILFLHGWGGATAVPDATGLAMDGGLLERIVSEPGRYEDFPFIVVAPHCIETVHGGCWGWTNHMLPIAALDDVAAAFPVDATRTYVSGLSTGGQGTFTVASMHAERFAAAIPIGSTYDERTPVCSMIDVPVWAFHGEFDTLQPPSNSQTYLSRIQNDCGARPSEDPALTLVPCRTGGSDHCGWVEAFDGSHGGRVGGVTDVFAWLLDHAR